VKGGHNLRIWREVRKSNWKKSRNLWGGARTSRRGDPQHSVKKAEQRPKKKVVKLTPGSAPEIIQVWAIKAPGFIRKSKEKRRDFSTRLENREPMYM